MSINKVEIDGGFTRDPEFKYAEGSGIPVWRATLAHNGTRYDSQTRQQVVTTTFCLLVAFGYPAEQLNEEYLQKGDSVIVRGQIGNNTFEKRDGTTETKTQIEVQGYDVLRKKSARQQQPAQTADWGGQQGGWTPPPASTPVAGGWGGNPDQEPPF